jgi:aminoglycoside phosphotransferase (APT) family kinase protein
MVIQHGDFGPNNALPQQDGQHIVAIVDWKFSGVGQAITDIAWCEWIVRMHHPHSVAQLPAFFDAYGARRRGSSPGGNGAALPRVRDVRHQVGLCRIWSC